MVVGRVTVERRWVNEREGEGGERDGGGRRVYREEEDAAEEREKERGWMKGRGRTWRMCELV